MYNPYIHNIHSAVHSAPGDGGFARGQKAAPRPPISPSRQGAGKGAHTDEQPLKKGLSELLKALKLEELDTGDVLLLLILLFLFLDDREKNLETLVTLGLMLIL